MASTLTPFCHGVSVIGPQILRVPSRNMATLKELRVRMKSVASVRKITSSMKAVAASKLKAAERRMNNARPFYETCKGITEQLRVEEPSAETGHACIVLGGDRGLCGAINGSIVRTVQADQKNNAYDSLVIFGEKPRSGLSQPQGHLFTIVATGFDARPVTMGDVAPVTDALLKLENQPKLFTVIRNHFVNVLTFRTVKDHFRGPGGIDPDEFFFGYEFEDSKEETLNDLYEYHLGVFLYSSLAENAAAEQGQRMVSMESATNNASDLFHRLELQYNKGRQASITKELIEIVSGQEALAVEED